MGTKQKSSAVRDRLIALCEALELSRREFSISIGRTSTYVTSLNNDITSGVLNDISITYPQVNIMWLITGKGEKFIAPEPTDALFQHLKEENKELKIRNEELNREIGKLQEQIKEIKKHVPEKDNVICAIASGSDLGK
mgnify:FL=1|jgi:hypothetical protein